MRRVMAGRPAQGLWRHRAWRTPGGATLYLRNRASDHEKARHSDVLTSVKPRATVSGSPAVKYQQPRMRGGILFYSTLFSMLLVVATAAASTAVSLLALSTQIDLAAQRRIVD